MSIEDKIKGLEWEYRDEKMIKVYKLASFREVIEFISDIGEVIERMRYYPLITIDGMNIKITLPRDNKIGEKDITLATAIEKIYNEKYKLAYIDDEELELLQREEEKEKAKHRTRGPYRKSSGAGLF